MRIDTAKLIKTMKEEEGMGKVTITFSRFLVGTNFFTGPLLGAKDMSQVLSKDLKTEVKASPATLGHVEGCWVRKDFLVDRMSTKTEYDLFVVRWNKWLSGLAVEEYYDLYNSPKEN